MDVKDLKGLFGEVKKRMDAQIEHVRRELGGVRTGRASVNILDTVHVEAYGSMMPLNQVASLSIPEPTLIVAQPFDPSLMGAVEKAIRAANLGLNPTNDGKVVRIPIPPLTEERRKELSKLVHKHAEEGRNGVRQVRRDANDKLKKLLKDHRSRKTTSAGASTKCRRSPISTSRSSTTCRRRRTANCSASKSMSYPFHPSRMQRAVRRGARSIPRRNIISANCGMPLLARYDLDRARARGRSEVARRRARRTCGATAS